MGKLKKGDMIGNFCLIVSLTLFFICMFVVRYESGYDTFVSEHESIYRVENTTDFRSNLPLALITPNFPITSFELRPFILNHYHKGEVSVVRLGQLQNYSLVANIQKETVVTSGSSVRADSNFFEFFDIEITNGNKHAALKNPNSIVLSESVAKAYFGKKNHSIGDFVHLLSGESLVLGGVFKDFPHNSHMSFTAVRPIKPIAELADGQDDSAVKNGNSMQIGIKAIHVNDTKTYVALHRVSEHDFKDFLANKLAQKNDGKFDGLVLLPMTDIHLKGISTLGSKMGNILLIYALRGIALIILLVAVANFSILQNVRLSRNQKALALLKTMGASPKNLIVIELKNAFFLASIIFLITLSSLFVAYLLVKPSIGFDLQTSVLFSSCNLLFIFIICFITVIFSIPITFYKTAFHRPISVWLKAKKGLGISGMYKQVVLGAQFCITFVMIIVLYQINSQINQIRNLDRGLNTSNVYNISGIQNPSVLQRFNDTSPNLYFVANQGKTMGIIDEYTLSSIYLPGSLPPPSPVNVLGKIEKKMNLPIHYVEPNFFNFFDIQILVGRGLSETFPGDQYNSASTIINYIVPIVINKETSRLLGFTTPEEALGERISFSRGIIVGEVIGVANNTFFGKQTRYSEPVIYASDRSKLKSIYIKTSNAKLLTNVLKPEIDAFVYHSNMEVLSFEDGVANLIRSDTQRSIFVSVICFLSLIIITFTTYSLYAVSVYGLRKDIAVRKSFGYSHINILSFLSFKLMVPTVIGVFTGALAGWLVNRYILSTDQAIYLLPYLAFISVVGVVLIFLSLLLIYYIIFLLAKVPTTQILNNNSLIT